MEVDVHVIDGPILPVKTHLAVALRAGMVTLTVTLARVAPHVSSVCIGRLPRMWI